MENILLLFFYLLCTGISLWGKKSRKYEGHKDNYNVSIMYHHQEESILIIFSLQATSSRFIFQKKKKCLALIGLCRHPGWREGDSF